MMSLVELTITKILAHYSEYDLSRLPEDLRTEIMKRYYEETDFDCFRRGEGWMKHIIFSYRGESL